MKRLIFTFIAAAIAVCTLQAQDLKPAKDKATKKYGYQDASKNWVIEPAFDKAKKFEQGVAIVTVEGLEGVINTSGEWLVEPEFHNIDSFDKDGLSIVDIKEGRRQKTYGVVNLDGAFVVPVDCRDVKIDNKRGVIHAERYFDVEEPERYLEPFTYAWGAYGFDGREIFAPQFSSRLSFGNDGRAIATDKATRKQSVVDLEGNVFLPFDYYYVYSSGSGYNALDANMRVVTFPKDFRTQSDNNYPESAPWMPVAYKTDGDVIRAFAYGHRFIGEKLNRNNVWNLTVQGGLSSRTPALTSPLTAANGRSIDWGKGGTNFARLEPVVDKDRHEGSFYYNITDTWYTVQLCLYDQLGRKISNVSNWGYLYAECAQGLLYMAEGKNLVLVCKDVNWPSESISLTLTGCGMIDNGTAGSALGLNSSTENAMRSYWESKTIHTDVELREKAGYQSYFPFVPVAFSSKEGKFLDMLERQYPFLHRKYYLGQVMGIESTRTRDGEVSINVHPDILATYHDDYGHSFTLNKTEPVYFGPRGDRYIRISLQSFRLSSSDKQNPAKAHGMVDDGPDAEFGVRFVFNLYEDDGTFVRTLGTSEKLTYAGHDIFGFDDIGWLFTRRIPESGIIRYREHTPLTGLVSDFRRVEF